MKGGVGIPYTKMINTTVEQKCRVTATKNFFQQDFDGST